MEQVQETLVTTPVLIFHYNVFYRIGFMKIPVKVVPGSSRNAISGWLNDALKVRVREKPEKGGANRAVERLLAKILALQPGRVRIVSGFSSARKLVLIEGMTETEIREKINNTLKHGSRNSP